MDDLDVMARNIGLGARGKANPMRSGQSDRRSTGDPLFNDVFGGQPKYASSSNAYTNHKQSPVGGFDYDSIFRSSAGSAPTNSNDNDKSSSVPVYDKPVYDDDIFDGLPGLKSKSGGSTVMFHDDVFSSASSSATGGGRNRSSGFDELLGNLERGEKIGEKQRSSGAKSNLNSREFDDLLAGLGSEKSDANSRPVPESRWGSMATAGSKHGNIVNDPFIVLGSSSTLNTSSGRSTNPLEEIDKLNNSRSARFEASSGDGAFDNLDPLSTIGKSRSFSFEKDNGGKNSSAGVKTSQSATTEEPRGGSSFKYSKGNVEEKAPADRFQEPSIFDVAKFSSEFQKSSGSTAFSQIEPSSTSEGVGNPFDDIWLVVSEVPLYTQPSTAPPPSRPPPPIPQRSGTSASSSGSRKKGNGFSAPSIYAKGSQSPNQARPAVEGHPVLQFDELEEFAMGWSQNDSGESTNLHSSLETNAFSAASAMKDAMDKAEAKFRHAKEVREREHARVVRNKESGQIGKDEQDAQIRETQDRLEAERKQKEEEERVRKRLERENARQAVERATREARERAAAEARERAAAEARTKAERIAVVRANAEARERAERAAVLRAQAEARERAAAEAKERAEKVAAEARGRAAAEAREKELQEKADVSRAEAEAQRRAERAAAEARARAAAQAREKAASAAKMNQQKNDNDLESFFNMDRASSAQRARTNTTDPLFEQKFQSNGGSDAAKRTPSASGASSTMKRNSSTTNFVDDLSSIFGAAPSGEFQEVEGEPEERRKNRLERHQRTQERAAKALEVKNQRDLQAQREQEERRRIAETLDIEIKRWAAGKEGNLRALLSTLQYVLWPECGWQPASLTDLISAASVKKVYRRATLCIHPDKVQQKGATLQQKYIAEKVFDLLKEAWNRFNSEELF